MDKQFKRVESVTAMICKPSQIAEQNLQRLNTPELLPLICAGGTVVNGTKQTLKAIQREVSG